MVARPAAVPRPKPTGREVSAPSEADAPVSAPAPAAGNVGSQSSAPVKPVDDLPSLDFADFVFSESSPEFHVEAEVDPVDAEAEQAAMLYANGQDEAVRSVLENAVRVHQFGPGERLWLMLFDFYRLSGRKADFEALEIDYARSFEKSPPTWSDKSSGGGRQKEAVAGSLLFKGNLCGDNVAGFAAVRQALEKNPRLKLDLSKVANLDEAGCGALLQILQRARKAKRDVELLGRDALFARLESKIEVGRPDNQECWLLQIELCQLQGRQEQFEDMAINYAVTFEVSPPSWEPGRIAAPEPVVPVSSGGPGDDPGDDAYVLRGDVRSSRFPDLPAYAGIHDPVLIDCSALVRMDFISAGALLNVLGNVRRLGKQAVFRHPNRLVGELFGVVGLNAVATIIFPKH